MPNEKISAMPAATSVSNADVLPIIQGGVNKKATKAVLLTPPPGEHLYLFTANGHFIDLAPDGSFLFFNGAASISVSAAGVVTLNGAGGGVVLQGPSIKLNGTEFGTINGANEPVVLDGAGKLPPVSGAALAALPNGVPDGVYGPPINTITIANGIITAIT
jgi:hypothetical protein